jgi:hypothetical protein
MMLNIKLAAQHWQKVLGLAFCVTCLLSAPISSQAQSQYASVLPPIISLLLDNKDKVTANATGKLNDTGIVFSGNYDEGNNDSTNVTIDQCVAAVDSIYNNQFARQDCGFGRDADTSVGDGDSRNNPDVNSDVNDEDGAAGFSFLKVSSTGAPMLVSDMSLHACVKDNVTGLMWEVKTDDDGLHHKNHTYFWDSTQAYVASVNAPGQGLCTYDDWRMPTVTELQGLLNYQIIDLSNPMIDTTFFPNTNASFFWSASPYASFASFAWIVNFSKGNVSVDAWSNRQLVRLVRGGQ